MREGTGEEERDDEWEEEMVRSGEQAKKKVSAGKRFPPSEL